MLMLTVTVTLATLAAAAFAATRVWLLLHPTPLPARRHVHPLATRALTTRHDDGGGDWPQLRAEQAATDLRAAAGTRR